MLVERPSEALNCAPVLVKRRTQLFWRWLIHPQQLRKCSPRIKAADALAFV